MGIKWTPEIDQIVSFSSTSPSPPSLHTLTPPSTTPTTLKSHQTNQPHPLQLLLKILETSQVNADVKAISAAWRKHPPPPSNPTNTTIKPPRPRLTHPTSQPIPTRSPPPAPLPSVWSRSARRPNPTVQPHTSALPTGRAPLRLVRHASVPPRTTME